MVFLCLDKPNYVKDLILVTSLCVALLGCGIAYSFHKTSKNQMKKVMEEMENLQKAEDSLMALQDKQVIPNVTQIQDKGLINYFPSLFFILDQLDKNHNRLEIMGDSLHYNLFSFSYIGFILNFVTYEVTSSHCNIKKT